MPKQKDLQKTNEVANEVGNDIRSHKTNGNRNDPNPGSPDRKSGGAERGGIDLDKAKSQQPPDATR
jgi:hypothetical protein